jgi:hypothetical protein
MRKRLECFSFSDIIKALNNLARSEWHQGNNDRGWVADPDFLIRSDEQIDNWLNKTPPKSKFSYI